MSENALAVSRASLPELSELPGDKLRVVQDVLCPGASPSELSLFWTFCQRTGLDPFAKQIYAIKRGGRLTIQTSIDGFRVIAERNPDYAGQVGPWWCGEDGNWVDSWLAKHPPSAARVGVCRKGFAEPLYAVALWSEYAQTDAGGRPTSMWQKMPATMLAKCAESQALRRAFPNDMSGVYTGEEMAQADAATSAPAPALPKREIVADASAGEVIGDARAAALKAAMDRSGIDEAAFNSWLEDKGLTARVADMKVADFPIEIGNAMGDWIRAVRAAKAPAPKPEATKFKATDAGFWKIKAEAAYRMKYPDRSSVDFDEHALNYPVHDATAQPAEAIAGWKQMIEDITGGVLDAAPSAPVFAGNYKQGSMTDADLPF